MSVVTNVILHIGILEDEQERIKEVNAFFGEHDNPLVGLSEQPLPRGWYGGTKYLECNVYVGAFNYFHLEEFIKHLQTIKWEAPEDLQLFVEEQNDTSFKIIYGVEAYDRRMYPLQQLLSDAQYLLEEAEKVTTNEDDLRELRKWQEEYKAQSAG